MRKLFFASIALTTFSLAIILFQFTSCEKAEAQTQQQVIFPIEGLWIGKYTITSEPSLGQQFFSIAIKPDGTAVVETKYGNTQHLSVGNWIKSGTTFTCNFTCVYGLPQHIGIVEKFVGTWDNTGTLNGTWENIPASGTGTVVVQRVN